jgi:hypothetical protein
MTYACRRFAVTAISRYFAELEREMPPLPFAILVIL